MNAKEGDENIPMGFWMRSERFIRRYHFAIGVLLVAFAITTMLSVFYDWSPLRNVPSFRIDDPTLLLSLAWGLLSVSIVSFGKEKNLIKKKTDVIGLLMELAVIVLCNMVMFYAGNVFVGKEAPKREEISVLRFVFSLLYSLSVVISFAFAEYVTLQSRGEEEGGGRNLTRKEIVTQLAMYGANVVFLVVSESC